MALTLDGTSGIVSSGAISSSSNITATGSITTQSSTGIIFSDSSNQGAAASPFSLKNRIINGDMVIDQRNAGASVTPATTAAYVYGSVDRWAYLISAASKFSMQQNAGSVTPPVGFSSYLGITSLSAYSVTAADYFMIAQPIEGFNTADLNWGTANAATVTLSFWIRSSLTGTFGGAINNSASNYSYPFSYTVSAANTWERKTITIAGPTAGTWIGATNGIGMRVFFSLGMGSNYTASAGSWVAAERYSATGATSVVGTNGATFYITGVQLERNTTATPFEWIPISTELALCQRYFCLLSGGGACGVAESTTRVALAYQYPVPMRAAPTATLDATKGSLNSPSTGVNNVTTMNNFFFGLPASETGGFLVLDTSTASWIASRVIITAGTTGMLRFSAEL